MKMAEGHIGEELISEGQIAQRVRELGQRITSDYAGADLVLVCILKGATIFWSDLSRRIDLPLTTEFVALSSYGDRTASSGVVRLDLDVSGSIEGKDILIIEDIIDSGHTMRYLRDKLLTRNPTSLRICVLLDKPSRREVEIPLDYVGFTVPDVFVVGYGLDFAQKYRNLPYVARLTSG